MGKRSRKQRGPEPSPRRAAPRAPRAPPGGAPPERPRAPWHPVPLVELCVLIGLVLLVWGLIRARRRAAAVMLVGGMALGSLGGPRDRGARALLRHALARAAPRRGAGGADRRRPVLRGARLARGPIAAAASSSPRFAALRRAFRRAQLGCGPMATRAEAHAAPRAAPPHRDLRRPRADDRVLPRPARARGRPRRPERRRPADAARLVRRARRGAGHARERSCSTPSCRPAWSASAPRTTSRSPSTARRSRRPGATTCAARAWSAREVFDRGAFRSIYLRDPDGHIVEIATAGPASPPAVRPRKPGRTGGTAGGPATTRRVRPPAGERERVDRRRGRRSGGPRARGAGAR